ncbi:hypothetical protein DSL92_04195 [Billgrantia gudaonensis]|uniref:Uncharacterized protein n=1 Tax=Billgrantia gudaonensis TaxID=376427 RepID=A0A3S0QG39_9GAMM|nr:hypothetical protein DSL92_04195 [Halomonas gudaonensis]
MRSGGWWFNKDMRRFTGELRRRVLFALAASRAGRYRSAGVPAIVEIPGYGVASTIGDVSQSGLAGSPPRTTAEARASGHQRRIWPPLSRWPSRSADGRLSALSLPPEVIELEITEHADFHDLDAIEGDDPVARPGSAPGPG